jgi:hypothetical protein
MAKKILHLSKTKPAERSEVRCNFFASTDITYKVSLSTDWATNGKGMLTEKVYRQKRRINGHGINVYYARQLFPFIQKTQSLA